MRTFSGSPVTRRSSRSATRTKTSPEYGRVRLGPKVCGLIRMPAERLPGSAAPRCQLPADRRLMPRSDAQGCREAQRMRESIGGGESFWADVTFIQISVRIPFDRFNSAVFNPYLQCAAAMVHPGAVGFDPPNLIRHLNYLSKRVGFVIRTSALRSLFRPTCFE